jgi:hypothetical protein
MTTAERDATAADSLTAARWVGVVAALVSAAVHLRLGVGMFPSGLGISFLLAGAGFLGGVALVQAGRYRRAVYAAGVPFTLVQVAAWYWLNFAAGPKSFPADAGTLGAIDKVAQFVLLGALVLLIGGDR